MVFTANQIEDFFLQEMKVPRETWTAMQSMGISDVDSLKDYTKDLLEHLRSDLRRPSGTMQDPNDAARLIPRTPYVLSPVSFHCLYVASEAVRYYAEVGCPLTAANMRWQGPLTAFEMYLKARTEEEKNQESLVVPVISKSNPIFQWSESWSIYLDAKLGYRKTAAKIIPADPVKNKRGTGSNKRKAQELQIGALDLQSRGSKTGVEFRFYKPHEYRNLTKEQKDELKEMRKIKKKIKAEKEAAEADKPNKKVM